MYSLPSQHHHRRFTNRLPTPRQPGSFILSAYHWHPGGGCQYCKPVQKEQVKWQLTGVIVIDDDDGLTIISSDSTTQSKLWHFCATLNTQSCQLQPLYPPNSIARKKKSGAMMCWECPLVDVRSCNCMQNNQEVNGLRKKKEKKNVFFVPPNTPQRSC